MVRVVIDTNVLVSALTHHGKPRRLVTRLLRSRSTVTSRGMMVELADVLSREKFALTEDQVNRFLSIYIRQSEVVVPKRIGRVVLADRDDDVVLGTAVAAGASHIITGDRHLLSLKEFQGIKIVTVDYATLAIAENR